MPTVCQIVRYFLWLQRGIITAWWEIFVTHVLDNLSFTYLWFLCQIQRNNLHVIGTELKKFSPTVGYALSLGRNFLDGQLATVSRQPGDWSTRVHHTGGAPVWCIDTWPTLYFLDLLQRWRSLTGSSSRMNATVLAQYLVILSFMFLLDCINMSFLLEWLCPSVCPRQREDYSCSK